MISLSAPLRLCAPSLARPWFLGSLMAILAFSLLAAPDTRAGTYDWTGTDPTTGRPMYSPAYSGGTTSETSATTNTHVSGQPDTLDTRPSPPNYVGISNVFCYPASNGSATSSTDSASGPLNATFTWQPAFAGEPAPSAVIIQENCSVTMAWSYSGGATLTGSDSTGFGQSGSISGSTGNNVTISGTSYSGASGGSSVSAPACSASASQSGSSGTAGGAQASFTVTYNATATPVTISLSGTLVNSNTGQPVLDSSGNQQILIGQPCTATLVGIPTSNGWKTTNLSWTVSGSTLAVWGGNNTSSTYLPFLSPNNSTSPSWYWSDLGPKSTAEKVTCTATVTPPAGEGAAFPISVTQNVTVYVPGWTCTGTAGTMQINSLWPSGNGTDLCLWAGPLSGTNGRGMTWTATVSAPAGCPALGTGVLEMVQIETPNSIYVSTAGTTYKRSNNGQQGLDSTYPYPFSAPSYTSGDSPGFDLTSHSAASAQLQYQFVDTLMFEPSGGGQYVPLANYSWSTPASSTASVSPAGTTNFTASNTFPSWTQNVGNASYTWIPQ